MKEIVIPYIVTKRLTGKIVSLLNVIENIHRRIKGINILDAVLGEMRERAYENLVYNEYRQVASSFLSQLETIPNDIRQKNIIKVNQYQESLLGQEGFILATENHSGINRLIKAKDSRVLIAYYRGHQMDIKSQDLAIKLMIFLEKYIEGGYSKLFDSFRIVCLDYQWDNIPKQLNSYLVKVHGTDFEVFTSLFANTIHFSNGTPNFLPGTIPILANAVITGWKSKPTTMRESEYVQLDLNFINYYVSPDRKVLGDEDFYRNSDNPYKVLLLSLRECEDRMIQKSKKHG